LFQKLTIFDFSINVFRYVWLIRLCEFCDEFFCCVDASFCFLFQISAIKNVLPQAPHDKIVNTLIKFNGNLEFAIQHLLEGSSLSHSHPYTHNTNLLSSPLSLRNIKQNSRKEMIMKAKHNQTIRPFTPKIMSRIAALNKIKINNEYSFILLNKKLYHDQIHVMCQVSSLFLLKRIHFESWTWMIVNLWGRVGSSEFTNNSAPPFTSNRSSITSTGVRSNQRYYTSFSSGMLRSFLFYFVLLFVSLQHHIFHSLSLNLIIDNKRLQTNNSMFNLFV
jgi:hypothetical protein